MRETTKLRLKLIRDAMERYLFYYPAGEYWTCHFVQHEIERFSPTLYQAINGDYDYLKDVWFIGTVGRPRKLQDAPFNAAARIILGDRPDNGFDRYELAIQLRLEFVYWLLELLDDEISGHNLLFKITSDE